MPDRNYPQSFVSTSTSANTNTNRKIYVNIPLPNSLLDERALMNGRYQPQTSYVVNNIRTSKYTLITFLPKNLFEQFRRVANSFFLLLVILQCFDEYMVVHPIIAAFPIMFIVGVTAIKDAVEDYKRWKNDWQINNKISFTLPIKQWTNYNYPDKTTMPLIRMLKKKLTHFFRDKFQMKINNKNEQPRELPEFFKPQKGVAWEETKWKNIRVGDFIALRNDDEVPADIIVLSTSEPDCVCYVETKNLDGETNLKPKTGLPDLAWIKCGNDCANRVKMVIESESPTTNMLKYQSTVYYTYDSSSTSSGINESKINFDMDNCKRIPVDINGILLRGAVIRNTSWVIGIVVFTGDDTKQVMNFGKTPSKRTFVDLLMNKHVAINLLFMLLLCLVVAIAGPVWFMQKQGQDAPFTKYLSFRNPFYEGFLGFWGGLILFQNIVPISLYISVEIVKTLQAYFIHTDLHLYYDKKDTPCQPRSWNLAENLGQIEYIFSDKTGTLTQNIMCFKKCSIAGMIFDGQGKRSMSNLSQLDSKSKFGSLKSHKNYSFRASWIDGDSKRSKQTTPTAELSAFNFQLKPDNDDDDDQSLGLGAGGAFDDEALNEYLDSAELQATAQGQAIKDFFTLLCLCHTVLVDDKQNQQEKSVNTIAYNAQSPDEACLVTLAAETGFIFRGREHNTETGRNEIITEILGEEQRFQLLSIIDFDSDRKRMSVIVRPSKSDENGDVLLFCKGADSVIFERLLPGQSELMKTTSDQLEAFAEEGLRTLCLAYRRIPSATYDEWSRRYFDASAQVYPSAAGRQRALNGLQNEIEQKLMLLGATAIEDKLQDGVPECITTLSHAGIKIWVLTGDKIETAINIGFLCGLLKSTETTGAEDLMEQSNAEMVLIEIKNAGTEEDVINQLTRTKSRFFDSIIPRRHKQEYALIIDGLSLKYGLDSPEARSLLLDIGCQCKAVICCRVSPLQKAKVVELVKRGKGVLTLAIGDGANDVSMIQAADIGIGISGEEGLQAALSADYAIAQFSFLTRLLLVHGRWCYSRIALMILNFNLKSLVFTLVLFWFQFYSGFSSAIIYEFTYMLFYNLVFTNLPVLFLGIFDQFIGPRVLFAYPQIYGREGIPRVFYTDWKFSVYFVEGVWMSLICYFLPVFIYAEGPSNLSGLTISSVHLGTVMAVSAITIVNLSVMLDMHIWNILTHLGNWVTLVLIFIYILFYSFIPDTPALGLSPELFPDAKFWLSISLAVVLALGPRFIFYFTSRLLYPQDSQILEEIDHVKSLDLIDLEKKSMSKVSSPAQLSAESLPMSNIEPSQLHRKPSCASVRSVAYSMDTGEREHVTGFSFAYPKGMGNILMQAPMSVFRLSSRISSAGIKKKTSAIEDSKDESN